MTSLWGPLGWMTLHSVSFLYPEQPSSADKMLLKRYMELFRDTITCPHCYRHFKILFENYTRAHPEWADSRFQFFLFVCRAHNTVNRRLEKPRYDTVESCIQRFRANTQITPAAVYRAKYLDYLSRNYGVELSGDNMMKLQSVRELRKITNDYWNKLSDESTSTFNFDGNVLEFIDEASSTRTVQMATGVYTIPSKLGVGLRGGRFRIKTG